jgi:UDP-N-acetylenolpyruvoylglucosamine reductase
MDCVNFNFNSLIVTAAAMAYGFPAAFGSAVAQNARLAGAAA